MKETFDYVKKYLYLFEINLFKEKKVIKLNNKTCNTNNLEDACESCDEESILHPSL